MDVYPVNQYDPLMPGIMIAIVAVVHVFLAQFAVGGGMLLCYFQWLAMTGRSANARLFVHGYFKWLVLISFVAGAVTGVGIWFTSIQVSAFTIGGMIRNFHWIWATEYLFFLLEVFAGYMFYRYHQKISDAACMKLLVMYAFAAWMSLFLINGIISWQLTPGGWIENHSILEGFFNPTFWPSLFFRTIVALTLAGLVACIVVNTMQSLDQEAKRKLINYAAHLLVPMVLMPILGGWFLLAMPADSRGWVLGGSPTMNLFLNISVGASMAIGGYALIGLYLQRLYINGATATLLLMLAFGATAGGEFVREGSRKPYSIRYWMYSNGIHPDQVAQMRKEGCLVHDPYPLVNGTEVAGEITTRGAKVFRRQCAVCHTVSGLNGVTELTASWDEDQMRMNIAKLQHTKPFMPPFAGNAEDLESLVRYLKWFNERNDEQAEAPMEEAALADINKWLDQAGTEPASKPPGREAASSEGES
ncbi:c-type cytochrome [Bremerella sp. JC817]|uniref:c-type cytochrome n=1 Tax=Bremerella sp. JC817 TaxID=3231756 RepID=UPI00345973B6